MSRDRGQEKMKEKGSFSNTKEYFNSLTKEQKQLLQSFYGMYEDNELMPFLRALQNALLYSPCDSNPAWKAISHFTTRRLAVLDALDIGLNFFIKSEIEE